MKPMFLMILMLLTGWAAALEGSLVMRSPGQGGSGLYAVVSPSTGNMTLYAIEGTNTTRYGSGNFLADLANLEGLPGGKQGAITYSALRIGHPDFVPTPSDLLASVAFPDKPSAKESAAGLKGLRWRAIEAEDAFWAEPKPYDGVVRGAMGSQYLLLCVPIKHALLCYDCQDRNKGPVLVSFRNYGVDLMIPQTFASEPAPQAILNALPAEIKDEQKKAIEDSLNALAEGGGALKLEPSDPWIASGAGDRWVLVDPPNKHIVTYEYQGKKWAVKSSRNIEVEHLIPTSFRSGPNEQDQFNEYIKSRKKQLDAAGIIPDVAYFKALVDQKQVASGKTSEIQANIVGDDLRLPPQRCQQRPRTAVDARLYARRRPGVAGCRVPRRGRRGERLEPGEEVPRQERHRFRLAGGEVRLLARSLDPQGGREGHRQQAAEEAAGMAGDPRRRDQACAGAGEEARGAPQGGRRGAQPQEGQVAAALSTRWTMNRGHQPPVSVYGWCRLTRVSRAARSHDRRRASSPA
jgi:hypothetical protein